MSGNANHTTYKHDDFAIPSVGLFHSGSMKATYLAVVDLLLCLPTFKIDFMSIYRLLDRLRCTTDRDTGHWRYTITHIWNYSSRYSMIQSL